MQSQAVMANLVEYERRFDAALYIYTLMLIAMMDESTHYVLERSVSVSTPTIFWLHLCLRAIMIWKMTMAKRCT